MKRVVVLDTWVNALNLGNKIIVEAVHHQLREVFPDDFMYSVPAMEYIRNGRERVKSSHHVFVAGTNLLSADMNRTSDWRIRLRDALWMKNVILMGVGWWQYQDRRVNASTRFMLGRVLSHRYIHSVRDSYSARRLKELGFRVVNTGCPSIWQLDEDHCEQVPESKSDTAIVTFSEYNQKPDLDRALLEIAQSNYKRVYVWPQQYGDYEYAKKMAGDGISFISPSLEAYDEFLSREDVDFVGTRLHAGIRALQHKRRSIILAIDNRAAEMGRDFSLPVLPREHVTELDREINRSWRPKITLDHSAIAEWKNQFSRG